jgi:hypothetical protein
MADDLQYSEAISKTRNHSISVMESADKGRGAAHQLIIQAKKIRFILFFKQKAAQRNFETRHTKTVHFDFSSDENKPKVFCQMPDV